MSKGIIVLGSLHYDIFVDSSYLPKIGETIAGNKWYPKLGGKGGNQARGTDGRGEGYLDSCPDDQRSDRGRIGTSVNGDYHNPRARWILCGTYRRGD